MVLNRALDGIMPCYRELFAQHDLTEQQWRILRALWEFKELRFVDLAEYTLLPKPSLVGIVDRLEARGLVERRRSKVDRRAVSVVSTAKGRALAEQVLPKAQAIHNHIRSSLTDDEWLMIEAAMEKVATQMSAARLEDIIENS